MKTGATLFRATNGFEVVLQNVTKSTIPLKGVIYSCDSNCRSVVICSNRLKVLSCNGSIRRHCEIYGRQHGSN